MSIELPKDAEGREIPLDTSELFISDGTMVHVLRFEYLYHTYDAHDAWFVYIERTSGEHMTLHAYDVHLIQPESWKKLKDDLSRAASCGESSTPACTYTRQPCAVCRFHSSENCTSAMCADILNRIRELRGANDE